MRFFDRLVVIGTLSWMLAAPCFSEEGTWQVIDVPRPQRIAASTNRDELFFVQESGELSMWKDGQVSVLVEDLKAEPSNVDGVQFLLARDTSVAAIGQRDGMLMFAGYRLKREDSQAVVEWQPGLSTPLAFLESRKIQRVAATDGNIFVFASQNAKTDAWFLKAGVATLAKPVQLFNAEEGVGAVTVNFQGHLMAASVPQESETVWLRFYHAETGKRLLQLATPLTQMDALVVGPDELLYATGRTKETSGVFRLDAIYEGGRQAIKAQIVKQQEDAEELVASNDSLYVRAASVVSRYRLVKE